MNVKKYFIVKNMTLLGREKQLMCFGMYRFASTNPSSEQVERFGFYTKETALGHLEKLSNAYGAESVHGCSIVELETYDNMVFVTQSHIGDR